MATLTPDVKSDEDSEPSYDLKAAALRACTQHRAGGEGQGGKFESDEHDMFVLEFGDDDVGPRPSYKSGACPKSDVRTHVLEVFPGGLQDWEYDIGMHVSCPAILMRR